MAANVLSSCGVVLQQFTPYMHTMSQAITLYLLIMITPLTESKHCYF